ncbi:Cilia and flagella associated protein 74 [Podarcis lilfordi]|uniref:Cilia and flagella associated protein 74 n=1 Tax=Podarcis lilfordi TaxID=74358 RepID=A0AA35KR61_9SAUR|nr:Cilia and flagella associated protein 74 [Podarcis lilfordi]
MDQINDMESTGISEENLRPEENEENEDNEEDEMISDQLVQEEESWKGPELEDDYEEEARTDSNDALEGGEEEGEKGEHLDSIGQPSREGSEQPKTQRIKKTMNYADRVRVLNLRRNLNQLDNLAKEKEMIIRKTREELDACHSHIDSLTNQQRVVESEIEREKEAGNSAAVFRLQAMHRRVCVELGNEKDLESKITAMLNESLLEMWKIEIEQGNFSELRNQIKQDEEYLDQQNQMQAAERLQNQKNRTLQLNQRWLAMERKIQKARDDYDHRLSKALEDAQRNHEKAVRFLKKSLGRIRDKEANQEQKNQEYMQKRMETVLSLKNNISSNRDFDIGKTYKKKMILINAFYSINYCKLVGVSEHLKDFFTVHFDPPGPMSSGMSCEVGVTFKPMINQDLEGEVTFLSQIGSFSIPLKCSTKKCVLALDKELIDFGTHVVGETISRTITLTNCGALGTRFQLRKAADTTHTAMGQHTVTAPPSIDKAVFVCAPVVETTTGNKKDSNFSMGRFTGDKETVSLNRSEEVIHHTPLPDNFEQLDNLASDTDIIGESLQVLSAERPPGQQSREEVLEITVGKVSEGDIGPFSSVKLQIMFTPAVPGAVQADFKITFDNPDCKPLSFSVTAVSVAVPVWVPNPNVDLKICMYDRLYQDCIIIQSRAKSALRLKFEVCKELANHMELLPKTGYIQAHSSFSVQLKFLPRHSLREDARKYFDVKTRVLEVPMTVMVSDQSKPVEFTVHAIVTTSDLEIRPTEVDFGFCSIYEAVQTTITLTNKAILPQEFGFVELPEFVEIQPNDGFGMLLPLEQLQLDIIFKAQRAKEYSFELTCKTEINREFKLSCKAVGVHPPLELSHTLVQFSATALNDVSTANIFVINNHVSVNQFTHSVPRVGKGEVAPVGPTSFQFLVPEDSPITIMPCVGTVLPGKKCMLEVSFRPVLCDQLIRLEAVHLLCQAAEAKAQMERKARELELQRRKEEALLTRKDGKRPSSILSISQISKHTRPFQPPNPEDISPDSEEYIAAHLSLIRSFANHFDKYVIPCLIACGDIDEKKGTENLHYNPYFTLYLELHCPSVAPALMVTSNNGRTVFNFGDVGVGHTVKKEVKLHNISQEQLVLGYSFLNPFGSFTVLNPFWTLEEGESRNLLISFCPEENTPYFEMLEIRSGKFTLTLTLTGQGVIPSISCSVEGDVFNMGYVLAKETATATFKIENTSNLTLKYNILLDSLSPSREREQPKIPPFLASPGKADVVGTQNYNGLSVFSVSPVEGTITFKKCQEFTITFSPDHESLYYSDCIHILIFGKETIRVIQLKGAARNHIMFVEGGDPLDVPIESLAVTTSMAEEASKAESGKSTNSILLNLECVQSETFVIPATRELRVGAIRSTQFASKKNVEFNWENMQLLQLKGFTVDPVKGSVERGQTKPINVSWVPPAGSNPNQPVTGSAILNVKGDIKEVYSVYFMGRIVTK